MKIWCNVKKYQKNINKTELPAQRFVASFHIINLNVILSYPSIYIAEGSIILPVARNCTEHVRHIGLLLIH